MGVAVVLWLRLKRQVSRELALDVFPRALKGRRVSGLEILARAPEKRATLAHLACAISRASAG
jgi:hypothetical protein